MSELRIPLQQLDTGIPLPRYAYPGDAGVDLYATCDEVLQPFERKMIPCGIALSLPQGYAGFILPRSGLALKHGISLVNAPGLIDSGYRGQLQVVLINLDSKTSFEVKRGERIAQLVILKTEEISFLSCDKLSPSERDGGGFGSSGL